MPPYAKSGLCYNRPEGVIAFRPTDSGETDTGFYQRQQECREKNKANRLLNAKSKEVVEEIYDRLWATMYLHYLVERVHRSDRVLIEFSDLPDLQSLSMSDNEPRTASPTPDFDGQPYELQIQVLDLRLKDARIGTEPIRETLKNLIYQLTFGKRTELSKPC